MKDGHWKRTWKLSSPNVPRKFDSVPFYRTTTCCQFATTSRYKNAGSVSLPFMFVMVASGVWPTETHLASDMGLGDWMEIIIIGHENSFLSYSRIRAC